MPINISSPANVQKNSLMVFPAGSVVGDYGHLIFKSTNLNLLSKIENVRVHLVDDTASDVKISLYGYNGTSYFAIAENIPVSFDTTDIGLTATVIDESTPLWLENTGTQIHSLYGKVNDNGVGKVQFIIDFEQYSDVSTFPINNATEHDTASGTPSTWEIPQNTSNLKWEVFDNDLASGSVTFSVTGAAASYISPTSGTITVTNGYGYQNFTTSGVSSNQSGTITASNGVSTNISVLGTFNIEFRAYGAGGGPGNNYSGTGQTPLAKGGDGGYAQGTLTSVSPGETFYIVVGEAGTVIQGVTAVPPNTYNGGGRGSSGYYGGSGGGATHVATNTGVLTSQVNTQGNVILVAGGGGGGGNCSHGGAGGGTNGEQPASSTQYSNRTGGLGGTQTAGGAPYNSGSIGGSFGLGGYSTLNLTGGGGGGWYGGGTGENSAGGGGGSGYIGFTGTANLSALTSATLTQGGHTGSGGFLSPNSNTSNTAPTIQQASLNGYVEVYKNGVLDSTFNYTGTVQTYTV